MEPYKRVKFLGRIIGNRKVEILSSSLVQVIPSLYESFGLVALEGMTVGTPIIAAKAGGLQEIIIDNISGLLYNPYNYKELCNKIELLIDDKVLWEKIQLNQLKEISMKFSEEVYSKQFLEYLEK